MQKNFLGIEHLTLRSLIMTALGSAIITASSMYVALRMSALPWPTIFVSVLCLTVLRLLGKTNRHEINISQTGMSAGAMVAGGVCFTLPGLWITGQRLPFDPAKESFRDWMMPHLLTVLIISLVGVIMGTLLCYYLRRMAMLRTLPYPIGEAAAETIENGVDGGKNGLMIALSLIFAAVLTILRDSLKYIPDAISTKIASLPIGLALSPMAIGIGYIIGFAATAFWLIGALCRHWLINVVLVNKATFKSVETAGAFALSLAVGLMVGSGIATIIGFLRKRFITKSQKNISSPSSQSDNSPDQSPSVSSKPTSTLKQRLIVQLIILVAFALTLVTGLSPVAAALCLLGVGFATVMAASITGQTGINPMEIFGIIVLLAVRLFLPLNSEHAFFVAAIVAIACGYAGDMMNDYKAGYILKTSPSAQLVAQIVGGIVGSLVATVALFAIIAQFGGVGGTTGLSATQAFTVSSLIQGLPHTNVFFIACGAGMILQFCKVPAMILGIGLLLPLEMSTAIFFGGVLSLLCSRLPPNKLRTDLKTKGNIVAAGLLGGEGFAGTCIALIAMFSSK